MHSDQTEFCVSYDFLIASGRAPIVKGPLAMPGLSKAIRHQNDIVYLRVVKRDQKQGAHLVWTAGV